MISYSGHAVKEGMDHDGLTQCADQRIHAMLRSAAQRTDEPSHTYAGRTGDHPHVPGVACTAIPPPSQTMTAGLPASALRACPRRAGLIEPARRITTGNGSMGQPCGGGTEDDRWDIDTAGDAGQAGNYSGDRTNRSRPERSSSCAEGVVRLSWRLYPPSTESCVDHCRDCCKSQATTPLPPTFSNSMSRSLERVSE